MEDVIDLCGDDDDDVQLVVGGADDRASVSTVSVGVGGGDDEVMAVEAGAARRCRAAATTCAACGGAGPGLVPLTGCDDAYCLRCLQKVTDEVLAAPRAPLPACVRAGCRGGHSWDDLTRARPAELAVFAAASSKAFIGEMAAPVSCPHDGATVARATAASVPVDLSGEADAAAMSIATETALMQATCPACAALICAGCGTSPAHAPRACRNHVLWQVQWVAQEMKLAIAAAGTAAAAAAAADGMGDDTIMMEAHAMFGFDDEFSDIDASGGCPCSQCTGAVHAMHPVLFGHLEGLGGPMGMMGRGYVPSPPPPAGRGRGRGARGRGKYAALAAAQSAAYLLQSMAAGGGRGGGGAVGGTGYGGSAADSAAVACAQAAARGRQRSADAAAAHAFKRLAVLFSGGARKRGIHPAAPLILGELIRPAVADLLRCSMLDVEPRLPTFREMLRLLRNLRAYVCMVSGGGRAYACVGTRIAEAARRVRSAPACRATRSSSSWRRAPSLPPPSRRL